MIYRYDKLPQPFRVQVIQTLDRTIGTHKGRSDLWDVYGNNWNPGTVWRLIHERIAGEIGEFDLWPVPRTERDRFAAYLQAEGRSAGEILDAIEFSFRIVGALESQMDWYQNEYETWHTPAEAVEMLNHRFRQHDLGYQFVEGELIRVDSQFVHAEIVEPAIVLLRDTGFDVANDEFLSAHRHYRRGEARDAIADALNAFESTMKAICDKAGWARPANATAAPLVDLLIQNDLISKDLESHYKGLVGAMKSGLPTIGNRTSRHGHGSTPIEIPDYLAAHTLHLAAANIVFLVEAWKARGGKKH